MLLASRWENVSSMLKEERTTKTTVVILVIIAAVLSIFAYQYSTFTEQFNLEDLVLSIVRDTQKQIEIEGKDKDIKLEYRQSKDDIVLLHADKQRITQVISNLIDNAIKFTKRGTISIVIDRKGNSDSNSNSPNEVTVSVKDTGSGIHPDILPRLFSKFASKSFQGTGLGLFISKNIIEAYGGKLWGENNADGRGATFTFSLPVD